MKLTLKFGLVFITGLTAVLAVYVWSTLQRETDLFLSDMGRDNLLSGRVIAAAVEEVGEGRRAAAVKDLLRRIGRIDTPVRARWVSADAPAETADAPRLAAGQLADLREGRPVRWEDRSPGGRREFLTYVPVRGDALHGAIEVSEPLEEAERYVNESFTRIVATTGAVVIVCGLLFSIIGMRLVGRPVGLLVDAFHAVAAGELGRRPAIRQRDELGSLARAFDEMCDQLAAARARAEQEESRRLEALDQLRHADRLRTVGQLTAGVAHELGTPLNVVWARASMIARGEVAGAEIAACATIIEDQSQRMTRIIRKLLEFARPRPPQRAPADLRGIIQRTFEVLGATARKQAVALNLPEAGGPRSANVDAGQIQQVLSNLLLNAIQATPDGGAVDVDIRTERATPPADVGGPEAEYLCISVQDHGVGISPADLPKIFEPFFTTKDVGEGTGLGLSVSRGIIHEHGGWIAVSSRPGAGACFMIYLPKEPSACADVF